MQGKMPRQADGLEDLFLSLIRRLQVPYLTLWIIRKRKGLYFPEARKSDSDNWLTGLVGVWSWVRRKMNNISYL